MSSGQRIIKNSIFLTSSQVLAKVINFGLILVLTRMLGKEGFGLYSYSFAYVSIFLFFTHMGITNLQVREIAKYKEQSATILANTFPIVLILSGGFLLLVNIIPFVFQWSRDEQLISFVFSIYFLFNSWSNYFLAVMQAFERMEYQAIIKVTERFLILMASILCWYFNASLLILVILFTLIMVLESFLSFLIVFKNFVRFKISFSAERAKTYIMQAYPFALVGLFATVNTRIDIIMLKNFHSIDSVAVYSTARKIIESLAFLPESIYYAVFPALSLLFLKEKTKFNQLFDKSLLMMLLIAIPVSAGLFVLAPQLINVLFESEFSEAAVALRWLSIALGIIFIRHSFALVLNAVGKQHLFALLFGISMIINIILNLWLIPKYEILGACIAAIVSEFFVLLLSLPFLSQFVHFSGMRNQLIRLIFVGVILTMLIYFIQNWNLLIVVLIVPLVYGVLLIALRIISKEELRDLSQIFRNKISVD